MRKGVIIVLSNPTSEEQEDEYNAWYNGVHKDELLVPDGVKGITRYKISTDQIEGAEIPPYRYLAVYDMEDMENGFPEMAAVTQTPSDAIDPKSSIVLFDEIYRYRK